MNKIYSLHIGIDNYHPDSNVPPLNGCVNDVTILKSCLESIFPNTVIRSKTLFNESATYQNVIDHFGTKHLLQAEANDMVLIQYAGHGSQAKSAPEFAKYFPDSKDETMICYDSRASGGLDLADKELCILIDRIAKKEVHVVVVMDCCHSGSGTRNINIVPRQYLARPGERNLEQYIDGYFAKEFGDRRKITLPTPKHILLAACDRTETAGEMNGNGLFTSNLVKVLKETSGNISYANLFGKVQLLVARITNSQHPQFETTGFFNSQSEFLKNSIRDKETYYKLFERNGNWIVDRGIIHGLSADPGKKTIFKIYDQNILLGHATSKQVFVEDCLVDLEETMNRKLNAEKVYDAKMISFMEAPYFIQLQTNEVGERRLTPNLEKYIPVSFELQKDICADYSLEVSNDEVRIVRTADNQLIRCIVGTDEQKIFQDAFDVLEVIAGRERKLQINNKHRQISEDSVKLELTLMDAYENPVDQKEDRYINLPIKVENGKDVQVPFFITLYNQHQTKDLYCALYYFSENFDVLPLYNGKIDARRMAIAVDKGDDGDGPCFHLGEKRNATDTFKLFVSTRPLQTFKLEAHHKIKIGETVTHNITRSATRSTMSNERAIANLNQSGRQDDLSDDWFCKTMEVVSSREFPSSDSDKIPTAPIEERKVQPAIPFSATESNQPRNDSSDNNLSNLSSSFEILNHPTFKYKLEPRQRTRGGRDINSILNQPENQGMVLMNLKDGTRGDAFPVLEISDFGNLDKLKTEPLQIKLKNIATDEMVLPFTYDGEHILPVGEVENDGIGNINISINDFPDVSFQKQGGVTSRSLTKAVKLYFLKTVLRKNNVSKLQYVDFSSGKAVRKAGGAGKVAAANKIVLVVHGIVGDTKTIIPTLKPLMDNGTADLMMTFDYENLNTPIEESALQLKNALNHVGINSNSNKKITIVAHSMGGLVSRYFVEKLGGNQMVDRLIMAGTPNLGSNISEITTVRKWAKLLFTVAANTGFGIPASASILTALNYTKNLTVTLEQMNDDSKFLKDLGAGNDPGIPYHIIAGDFEQYCKECGEEKRFVDKLYKISSRIFYRNQDHDIAVAVSSIEGINASRNPRPTVEYVSCHHLNYFMVEKSLDKIMHWVGFEDPMRARG